MMTTTTTTTTTTTAVVAAVTVQQAIAFGVFATALLIGLLVLKEVLLAYATGESVQGTWKARAASFYAANLNVAIVPMMFVFGIIVVAKVATLL